MKIQIDTNKKTIKFEDDIKISKLIKVLKTLFPKDWKEYIIQPNTKITEWVTPGISNNWQYYNVPSIVTTGTYIMEVNNL